MRKLYAVRSYGFNDIVILLSHSSVESDFTAATILDKFANQTAAQSVERVLKKLSTQKATELLSVSPTTPPNQQYTSSCMSMTDP